MDIDKLFLSSIQYKVQRQEGEDGKFHQTVTDNFGENSETNIQNKLIRNYIALLLDWTSHEDHTQRTTNILHRSIDNDTQLLKRIIKDLEKGIPNTVEEPYGFYSLSTQIEAKNDYITGKIGIGPYALNNNNHILTMMYHVKFRHIDSSIMAALDLESLEERVDKNGESIMSWLSALINAHVDIAKDPYISRLNVNPFTYNLTNLLVRTGLGDKTFYFTVQPIMKELAQAYINAGSMYMSDPYSSKYALQEEAVDKVAEDWFKDLDFKILGRDVKALIQAIKEGGAKNADLRKEVNEQIRDLFDNDLKNDAKLSEPNMLHQFLYYLAYLQFDKYAKALSSLVTYSKIDTKKQGKNVIEQMLYRRGFNNVYDTSRESSLFDPVSLQHMLNDSYIGQKTENALNSVTDILSTQFIESTPAFYGSLNKMIKAIGREDSPSASLVSKLSDALSAAIKSQFFNDEYVPSITTNPNFIHDLVSDSVEEVEFDISDAKYPNILTISGDTNYPLSSYVRTGSVEVSYVGQDNQQHTYTFRVVAVDEATKRIMIDTNLAPMHGKAKLKGGKNTIYHRFARLLTKILSDPAYSNLKNPAGEISNRLLLMMVPGEEYEYQNNFVFGEQPDTYETLRFVKLFNFVEDSGNTANYIIDAWDELLHYTDTNKEILQEIRDFARDLIVYAFVTSGDKGGFTKMFKYVPVSWREESGYGKFIARKLLEYQIGHETDIDINDVILNNWFDNEIVRTYKLKDLSTNTPNFVQYNTKVNGRPYGYASVLAALKPENGHYVSSIDVENAPLYIKIARRKDKHSYNSQRRFTVYKLHAMALSNNGEPYSVYIKVNPKGTLVEGKFLMTEYGRNDAVGQQEYMISDEIIRNVYQAADLGQQLLLVKKSEPVYASVLMGLNRAYQDKQESEEAANFDKQQKEVFYGFNEIVVALGGKPMTEEEFRSSKLRNLRTGRDYSAMEAAYKMYHRNNGNMPDVAPNGKHSILFDSLLQYFGGDRKAAIKAKSNVYSNEFFNWFGDWTRLYGIVDDYVKYNIITPEGKINWEYFESLMDKYHNKQPDSMFAHGRYTLSTRPENHFSEEKNTLNHIKFVTQSMLNLLEGKYDMDLPFVSEARASLKNQKDLMILAAMFHDVAKPYRHGDIHGWESADILRDVIGIDYNNRLAEWAVRHHMAMPFSHKAEFNLSNPEAIEVARNMARDAKRIGIDSQTAINAFVLIKAADIINGREITAEDNWAKKAKAAGSSKYGDDISVKAVLTTELKENVDLLKKAFEDIKDENLGDPEQNYRNQSRFDYASYPEGGRADGRLPYLSNVVYNGVSKVVDKNGEPLVVYHGSDTYGFTVFDPSKADDKRSLFFSDSRFIASTYTSFEPLRNALIRKRLLDNNAVDLINNKDWEALKKLIKETIDYSLPLPGIERNFDPRYDYYIDEEISKLRQELRKPGLSEEEVAGLQADILRLEDTMWFSNNYTVRIMETRVLGQKEPKLVIKIDDTLKKDVESSRFIEKGIVFEGTPEQLIDAIQTKTKTYDLFLNIKNPLILDNQEGEFGASNNWDRVVYKDKEYRTRDISEIAKKEGYDGVIFRSIIDHGGYNGDSDLSPVSDKSIAYDYLHEGEDSYTGDNIYSSDVYIAYNPNQIKSATGNNGMFSTENNDILLHVNKRVKGTAGLSDEIQKEGYTTPQIVDNVVQFLSNKFPGLKIHVVDNVSDIVRENEIELNIVRGILSNKNISSFVYHGEVYIVRSRLSKQGGLIASEEILHMLVLTLLQSNPKLFNSLLKEAKSSFKKLAKEVENIYKNAGESTILNELVTLALARYVNRDIQLNKHSKFGELVKKFVYWLKSMLMKSSELLGNFVYIDPSLLKDLTLQELSDLINAEDTKFDINTQDENVLFHLNGSITRQMYDLGQQINNERDIYVRNIIDGYKAQYTDATSDDISRVMHSAEVQFDKDKLNSLLVHKQLVLANSFGLVFNQLGYYESSEPTQRALMLEYFINSLLEDTFKQYSLENINRTKYQQVGSIQDGMSAVNLIYTAMYDGDLVTLDKTLARDYVRMFWGSDLIQSALDSLNNNNKTAEQLENELVDRMTREPVESKDTSIVDWFRNIWSQLSQLVKQVFGQHTFTEDQKNDILKAVDAAYMLAEDLEYSNAAVRIIERHDGKYDSSSLLSDKDKQVLQDIRSGIKTRIKSNLSRKIKDLNLINDLKSALEIIDSKKEDSIDDIYQIIEDFLVFANREIGKAAFYIDRTLLIDSTVDQWNAQEVNFIQQDLIGYYSNMLSIVSSLFEDETSAINKFNKHRVTNQSDAIDLRNLSKQLKKDIEGLQENYNRRVVLPYVKYVCRQYVEQNDQITDKDTFLYNLEKWIEQDYRYGDLAVGEVLIGMASRSKSPVVRIVEKMMSQAEYKTHRLVLKKGNELMRLYNKIRPTGSQIDVHNWQRRFMEFDSDGIPTGYFVREINYGQFYKEKDQYEEKLRKQFGLSADEDGNTIFEDQDWKADNSVYNQYYDLLDKWLDDHCERRYTLEYYRMKRRFLSPKTLMAQNQIQRQIDLLLEKARMDNGFIDKSRLTINERDQLEILRKQKRDLASHYIFIEDASGVLRVEEKSVEGTRMADEINAWNDYIRDKVKYKPDWTSFDKAKQDLIDSGATQDLIDAFISNNTTIRITQEFYDLLHSVVGKAPQTAEMVLLKHRYTEIINALKERPGAGSHNLSKLGVGINTDRSGWQELHKIEQHLSDIRKELKRKGVTGQAPEDESLTFDQIATNNYVTVSDTNAKTYQEYIIDKWRAAAASNTNLLNVFNTLFMYKDEKGKYRYLKAFKYLSPLKWTLNVNGRQINCIESLPGSEYSELDKSSIFVNDKFLDDGPSLQAKKSIYKSKAYEDLTADERTFLQALLDTMAEANEKIPTKALLRDMLLPQISGRTMTVLANTIRAKEYSTALKYAFRKFGAKYAETEEDVSTNADLARRPDGTVVNNIPIRFIRKLDNPAVQTTDVLGSVIMYYDMACNFENKSQNLPTLELIKYAVDPNINNNQNKMLSQYLKIENMLDQRYYGKETTFGAGTNEKITPGKQRAIQATKTIRNMASIAMLGVNFTTIEVGYIDAMCSMFADAVASKYITMLDFKVAFLQCVAHTPKALRGLGKPVVDDKLVAAMQYNNLSRSNSDIFAATDKFKLDRFVKQHLLMGGYTLADYMVNGMMLRATYNHYRLITDPSTGKQSFMSKTDAINKFTKLGYTEKQAKNIWKKSKTTLWDAYDVVNGYFTLKDKYKDAVSSKTEDLISGRLRDRTAMYNGVIPATEKAKMQLNVFGSFITLMRNFYINTYWDKFGKVGGDYITKDGDHTIKWNSEYKRDDIYMLNMETGEDEGAVFKDFVRGMYKLASNAKAIVSNGEYMQLTSNLKYAVARCITEIGMITGLMFAMLVSVAFARSNNYDDDKDPAWTLNLIGSDKPLLDINTNNMDKKFMDFLRWKIALLSTRSFTERLTSWWAPTVIELFTSPSTATSYLKDIGVVWGLAIDLFSQRVDEEVKSGGYKHMTRGTRDILKLTSPFGLDNLVRSWHTDGIKSTFNYYRALSPTEMLLPSQSQWNEEHGKGAHGGEKKKNSNKKSTGLGEYVD